jgi:hypothetical protein
MKFQIDVAAQLSGQREVNSRQSTVYSLVMAAIPVAAIRIFGKFSRVHHHSHEWRKHELLHLRKLAGWTAQGRNTPGELWFLQ